MSSAYVLKSDMECSFPVDVVWFSGCGTSITYHVLGKSGLGRAQGSNPIATSFQRAELTFSCLLLQTRLQEFAARRKLKHDSKYPPYTVSVEAFVVM